MYISKFKIRALFTVHLCYVSLMVSLEDLTPSSPLQATHGTNHDILGLVWIPLSNLGRGCSCPWSE